MKSVALSFTACAVLLVAAGCPPPPPPVVDAGTVIDTSCTIDTNFPHQDPTTAAPITANTPVQGFLCPARDDDGYLIHVDTAGSIIVTTLSMDTNITNVNPGFSIFEKGADGTLTSVVSIESDPDTTAGHKTNFTAANRVEDAADYVIDVADVEGLDNGFDDNNQYTLTANVVPDPDANEPNNLPTTATPITSGTPINGIIATSGDQDWYSINVTSSGQIIDAALSVPAGSGVTHVATLLANDTIQVLQTVTLTVDPNDPTKEVARIRKAAINSAAGPFFLEVVAGGPDAATASQLDVTKGQYTITLNVIPDPDANEGATGNEDTASATAVTSGQTVTAALASFADRDVYEVTPPGGTSQGSPQVLVVDVTFDAGTTISEAFKPQVRIVGADPENGTNACTDPIPDTAQHCTECYSGPSGRVCAEDRLQRFVKSNTFHTAYPLRTTEPVFVEINEFNDDAFQDGGSYTVKFTVQADPDPGEAGDDFLIQNLEFAGFANDGELAGQYGNARPRSVPLGYQPVCGAGALPTDPCIHEIPVAHAVGFGFPADALDCSEVPTVIKTLTGRLTYEGDRDYFVFPDFPTAAYMNIDIHYTVDATTPVELTIFVHGAGGQRDLAGSFLGGAVQQNGCSEQQGGQNACAAGSICVDGSCWTDGDANPPLTDDFGNAASGQCIEVGPNVQDGPVTVEVVDNGLNDFDENMTYTLDVTVSCGCPAQCDSSGDFCQNG